MRYKPDQVIELGWKQALYIEAICNKIIFIVHVSHHSDGDYITGYANVLYKDLKRYVHKMKGRYV